MSKVIVALGTSRRMGDCTAYAKFISQRRTTEPVFASPTLPLAIFEAHIAALEAAEVRVLTRELESGPFLARRVTVTTRSVTPVPRVAARAFGSCSRRKA